MTERDKGLVARLRRVMRQGPRGETEEAWWKRYVKPFRPVYRGKGKTLREADDLANGNIGTRRGPIVSATPARLNTGPVAGNGPRGPGPPGIPPPIP